MNSYSIKGEPINLIVGRNYFIIDSLYVDDIVRDIATIDLTNFDQELREKVFRWNSRPYARFLNTQPLFHLQVIEIDFEEEYRTSIDKSSFFCSDTGIYMLVTEEALIDLATNAAYSYGDVVETVLPPYDTTYWENLKNRYNPGEIALISTPYDMEDIQLIPGGGGYKLAL